MLQTASKARYFILILCRISGLQTIFRRKSFILLKLSTQAFFEYLSKLRKKVCSVVFQAISQLQYWQKEMTKGLWFFSLSVSTVQPRSSAVLVLNGSTDYDRFVSLSTFPSVRPFIHPCVAACSIFIWETTERTKKEERRAGCLEQSGALSLWHKSSLWSLEHNGASPPAPLGQAANNTHNAACLWLPESLVAIYAQLVEDCARDMMPGRLSCQLIQ